jgi:hypothetical protein
MVVKIAIKDHQNKSAGIVGALSKTSCTSDLVNPDLLFIDHDGPEYYRKIIDRFPNAQVLLYPHGAMAYLAWDGLWKVNPRTTGYLAMSHGMADNMRLYGYPNPIAVTGWHWCEQKEYEWRETRRILFAPVHPLTNGWLWEEIKIRNAKTYEKLLKSGCEIVVRHIGSLEQNGLWHVDGVEYDAGMMDNSEASFNSVDLVVSFGTFAYLAVARGVPTVMYCQDVPMWEGSGDHNLRFVAHWEQLAPLIEYPYDIRWYEIGDELEEPKVWRDRYIGEQITPERLVECLNTLI